MLNREKLLNISEASKMVGVSPSTLRRMEQNGSLESYGLKVLYTPGGQRRYLVDEAHQVYTTNGFSGQLQFGDKVAVLIRDLTIGFTDPQSHLAVPLNGQIEAARRLAEEAANGGIPVIFSITVYDPNNKASRLWSNKIPTIQILDRNSTWVEIHPELRHIEYDLVVHTSYISSLYQSPINDYLRHQRIDTVILAGLTTNGSIRATCIDALQQGYRVIIAKETVEDRSQHLNASALIDLNARYADVVGLDLVLAKFKQLQYK